MLFQISKNVGHWPWQHWLEVTDVSGSHYRSKTFSDNVFPLASLGGFEFIEQGSNEGYFIHRQAFVGFVSVRHASGRQWQSRKNDPNLRDLRESVIRSICRKNLTCVDFWGKDGKNQSILRHQRNLTIKSASWRFSRAGELINSNFCRCPTKLILALSVSFPRFLRKGCEQIKIISILRNASRIWRGSIGVSVVFNPHVLVDME